MSDSVSKESTSIHAVSDRKATPILRPAATVVALPSDVVTSSVTGLPAPQFVAAPTSAMLCFPPPAVPYGCMNPTLLTDTQSLSRLFVGQVPYHLTAAHVAWLLSSLTGRVVWRAEKIVRWRDRQHTSGCYHVYVSPEDEPHFLARHQTALCLPFVVCVATNPLQRHALVTLCHQLRDIGPMEGVAPTPTQLLTIEKAKSTFTRTTDRRRPPTLLAVGAMTDYDVSKDSTLLRNAVPTGRVSP